MPRLPLLALLVLAACSGGNSDGAPTPFTSPIGATEVSLRNESDRPIVFVASGEGTLALLDIRPMLFPGEYEDRLVAPGRTVAVPEIIGYDPALGVTFYIYLIDAGSGEARFSGFFVASASELSRNDGLVRFAAARL
jgi:hypothetical protein